MRYEEKFIRLAGQDITVSPSNFEDKFGYFKEEVEELKENIAKYKADEKSFDFHKILDDLSDIQVTLNNIKVIADTYSGWNGMIDTETAYQIVSINNQTKFLPDLNYLLDKIRNGASLDEIKNIVEKNMPLSYFCSNDSKAKVCVLAGYTFDELELAVLSLDVEAINENCKDRDRINSDYTKLDSAKIVKLNGSLYNVVNFINEVKEKTLEKYKNVIVKVNKGSYSFLRMPDFKVVKPAGFINVHNTTNIYKVAEKLYDLINQDKRLDSLKELVSKDGSFLTAVAISLSNGGYDYTLDSFLEDLTNNKENKSSFVIVNEESKILQKLLKFAKILDYAN